MKKILLVLGLSAAVGACSGSAQEAPASSSAQLTDPTTTSAEPVATGTVAPPAAPVSTDARAHLAADRTVEAAADPAPAYREVTIPAGTVLPLTLRTSLASNTSQVEDPVRATLRRAITIKGMQALPAGTVVTGHVTNAKQSARVKGRGQLAFRFTRLDPPGDTGAVNIRTSAVSRVAPGTKKRDAATIGGGAVGGAIVGGIIGGGDGAAKGAAIGGAGGTGVVLATRGKEVKMAAGTPVSVRLTQPLTVRVPLR